MKFTHNSSTRARIDSCRTPSRGFHSQIQSVRAALCLETPDCRPVIKSIGSNALRALFIVAFCGVALSFSAARAEAQVIGFDDIQPSSTTYGVVPNNYNNLNWTNFDYIYKNYLPGSGYQFGTTSPNFAAFNVFGGFASLSFPTLFSLNSVDLTSAWIPNLKVTIEGLVNNVVVASSGPLVLSNMTPLVYTPTTPILPAFGTFTGIGALRFSSSYSPGDNSQNPAGTQFVVDDLNIT